ETENICHGSLADEPPLIMFERYQLLVLNAHHRRSSAAGLNLARARYCQKMHQEAVNILACRRQL
ncbi:hypothetical protein PanWU01x14_214570, partial [Parasponia andersonii]